MFRSFFPVPKIFFLSATIWALFTVVLFQTVGEPMRHVISIDRFLTPTVCAAQVPGNAGAPASVAPAGAPTTAASAGAAAATASPAGASPAPGASGAAAGPVAAVSSAQAQPAGCVASDGNFLNGARIWEYWYVLLCTVVFCAFWYFYRRNTWYWWSVVGSAGLLLATYAQVQLQAFLNDWQGGFFDVVQRALSKPGSVSPGEYWPYVITLMAVLLPNIIFLVLMTFFTSHYVFRWRKAMTAYYMNYWPALHTIEGAAQRVQEDTMRFSTIVEDLGTSFINSVMTLIVFLPILWVLSRAVTDLPLFGHVPGSLVWVALVVSAFGTGLLWFVGIRLPGLNFENQKVEAALRKELVYGEDQADRPDPPTFAMLFANVQRNYFRLYFHYTYFNLSRYAYLQVASYVPLLALSPSILAGTLTLGIYQQVQNAFGQVAGSFQFFAQSWTTIVELQSIYLRLRAFEGHIPQDAAISQEPSMSAQPG